MNWNHTKKNPKGLIKPRVDSLKKKIGQPIAGLTMKKKIFPQINQKSKWEKLQKIMQKFKVSSEIILRISILGNIKTHNKMDKLLYYY